MSTRMLPGSLLLLLLLCSLCSQISAANRRHFHKPIPPCCVSVSAADISNDVIGSTYREQPARPPCVHAIIANTQKGSTCVDPKAKWVKSFIANKRKL